MNTRDKIMDVALKMFAERGYEAVSIRDICGEVGIKESTLYYHFHNKKDVLDSLTDKFKLHIDNLLSHVDEITIYNENNEAKVIKKSMIDSYMMDSYLFDPFCNLMLRLMMIEQLHNEEIRALYEKTMFDDPFKIQMSVYKKISANVTISADDVEWIVREYHSYLTMLTFKYLLNGELTEQRKEAYKKEVHNYIKNRIML